MTGYVAGLKPDYRLHSTFGDALSDTTIWQRGRGRQDRLNNLAWWIDLTAWEWGDGAFTGKRRKPVGIK